MAFKDAIAKFGPAAHIVGAAVGGAVIEGVTFLYQNGGEALASAVATGLASKGTWGAAGGVALVALAKKLAAGFGVTGAPK